MAKKKPGIRSKYNPSDSEYADLQFLYQRKQDMADARAPMEPKWDKWEKQYEMYRPDRDPDDWQSNLTLPTTTSIVESQTSEIIDQNIRPRYLPRGIEDKPKAVVMNATSDYAWEVGRTDVELYKGTKDGLVKGTAILQDYYRKENRTVQWLTGFDKKGREEYGTREYTDYDDLFAEIVKLEDFYVDEKARGFTGSYAARDCIRRYIMKKEDAAKFFKGPVWDPFDNFKYVTPGGDTDYYEFYKPPEAIRKDDEVEILWYWGERPTPGRPDYSDHLMIAINDVMVKRGPNPYWHKRLPFVRVVDIMRSHQFYGRGESELLESIQEEQQTLRRMAIDRNHLDMDKSFLVSNRETELDEDDLISRPHMMVPVEDVENIKPLEYGDVPRSIYLSLEQLAEDAVRVTGYDDRMQSVRTPGTATEAAIMKEATLKRLRSKLWLLRNLTVYQMGLLRESNIRQFYTVPKVEKILGEKGSADYKKKVRNAYKADRLKMVDGEPYEKKYRTVRLTDKELVVDKDKKDVSIRNSKEPTFFEAVPELLVPTYGSFDVKLEPTPTMPVSKPLQQEKVSMLFDRLIQLAQGGIYDPTKLGDALLEAHDYDPDEFKPEKSSQQKFNDNMVLKSIDVAQAENKEILNGNALPPTPYAQEPHTEVHIAFINSPEMTQEPPDSPKLAALTRHIIGELQAQEQRAQAMPQEAMAGGEGGPQGYKPPSGPSALKQNDETAVPQKVQTQQEANQLGQPFQ